LIISLLKIYICPKIYNGIRQAIAILAIRRTARRPAEANSDLTRDYYLTMLEMPQVLWDCCHKLYVF